MNLELADEIKSQYDYFFHITHKKYEKSIVENGISTRLAAQEPSSQGDYSFDMFGGIIPVFVCHYEMLPEIKKMFLRKHDLTDDKSTLIFRVPSSSIVIKKCSPDLSHSYISTGITNKYGDCHYKIEITNEDFMFYLKRTGCLAVCETIKPSEMELFIPKF